MKKFLKKIFGSPETKTLKRLTAKVEAINVLEKKYHGKSVASLKKAIDEYKKQVQAGKVKIDDILPDVFAIVREASRQTLGQRPYDVQLVGGMALHEGNVTEMRTGEGKTLVATLPVVLNALEGKGVHVVTVNDYLAQRDAGWMGQIYNAIGISVGVIINQQTFIYDVSYSNDAHDDPRLKHLRPADRIEAYQADVTYGTNNEFGFDYLRDNMVREPSQLRQKDLHYAIVDEVDSILIDEARTPLIISASATESGSNYQKFASIVKKIPASHYVVDEKQRAVSLNDEGIQGVQDSLGIDNLYAPEYVSYIYHLEQALNAEVLHKRDKDYVVTADGEVVIVDEFTGRMMQGRRYSEGLHQAIEAKEGVAVKQESTTLATISFQNYFRLYKKLSGMTGTAETEAEEFYQIYKLGVVVVPTNRPMVRNDMNDLIFKSQQGKYAAVTKKVKELQASGQPVLIGTASIEKNELLSGLFLKAGIEHNVLNAKNNESEAATVAKAGQAGAVTLATNIAGRGTDIVLGKGVVEKGGLFVLGSERHEARRIDNQLRGRTGRQGDPGTTQFFVSAEDDLMRIFGGERIAGLMTRMGVDENTPIENKALSRALETAQKKVEGHNYDSRKHVVQYDDVMNRHRKAVYSLRRSILIGEDIDGLVASVIADLAGGYRVAPGTSLKPLVEEVTGLFALEEQAQTLNKASHENFSTKLREAIEERVSKQNRILGKDIFRLVAREMYLQILDSLWMQHLENMDHLREGIGWRQVGQKDPLVEYRREGQQLYEMMQATLRLDVVRGITNARPIEEPEAETEVVETELTRAARQAISPSKKTKNATETTTKGDIKVTRRVIDKPKHDPRDLERKRKKKERKNRKKNRR